MKPIHLEITAFGPFALPTVIDFSQLENRSFFLIHGSTGAGKSTVLDAICYALYGEASNRDHPMNGSGLISPQPKHRPP